jgi:hypothetical protein
MRFHMIAIVSVFVSVVVSILALTPGALAQSAEQASPGAAAAQSAAPTQDDIVRQHPNWFTEEGIPYRPCPCSVVFPNGRHACLGLP